MTNTPLTDAEKLIKVIRSCKTYNQLCVARKMYQLWFDKHKPKISIFVAAGAHSAFCAEAQQLVQYMEAKLKELRWMTDKKLNQARENLIRGCKS